MARIGTFRQRLMESKWGEVPAKSVYIVEGSFKIPMPSLCMTLAYTGI